jgi:hypothetical protein
MGKGWLKEINKDLSVSTFLSGDGSWEIYFKGEQGKKKLGYNNLINLWEGEDDPEGVQAKKVHDRAIVLLEAGTTLKKTHLEIEAMINKLIDEIYG